MANDLLRQLIASPHALPRAAPRSLLVAPNSPLPANLRFGPTNPSQVTNSPYSGAVTGGLNLVHPDPPPVFQAPTYQPLGAAPPSSRIAAALAPILGAFLTGGTRGPGPPGPGPRTDPTPFMPRPTASGIYGPLPPPAPGPGPRRAPGGGGGLLPVTPTISGGFLAGLAQGGTKLGAYRPGVGGNVIRF